MNSKEQVGKILKKAVRILPGIGSYQDKDSIRESDKKIRDRISSGLDNFSDTIEKIKTKISRKGSLINLKELDALSRLSDNLSRAVKFASRGYSGIFNSVQSDEKALNLLFEFDQDLMEKINLLTPFESKIIEKQDEKITALLDEIQDILFDIEKKVNEREDLLKV